MKETGHSRTLRTFAVFLIALAIIATSMPFAAHAAPYDAESEVWSETMGGVLDELGGHKAGTQTIIDFVVTTYGKQRLKYKGRGECYGYAEMIRKMFGTGSKQKKIGVRPNKNNIWKYLKKCKPGTHVRFSQKKNDGGYGHSVVILKASKQKVWTAEANVGGVKNGIRLGFWTPAEFAAYGRGYGYLAWIRKPTGKPKTVGKLDVRAVFSSTGAGYISWRPLKKAKKYEVYRSTSKSSGYTKIATVKSGRYVDKNAPMGTVYYKVKAKGKTSKPAAAQKRLPAPKVYLKHSVVKDDDDNDISTITLTWNAVPGATKYIITDYDNNTTEEVIGTSYVKKAHGFYGSVKASEGNSKTDSYEAGIGWTDATDW